MNSGSSPIKLFNLQRVLQGVIELHDGRLITTPVTVVGCAENRYHIAIMAPVVALEDKKRQIN